MDRTRSRGAGADTSAIERLEHLGYSLSLPPPALDDSSDTETTVPAPQTRPATSTGDRNGGNGETHGARARIRLPASSIKKEDLTLSQLRAIVDAHRLNALSVQAGREERTEAASESPSSVSHAAATGASCRQTKPEPASTVAKVERTRRSRRGAAGARVATPSPPSSPSSPTESPTSRCVAPSKRRKIAARSLPLLSLLAASTAASSLLSTCESLVQLSPALSFPDLVHFAQSLQANAQMLAIAQCQALASGRTFGSSLDTLARIVSTPPRSAARDPSASALVAAKALNLFALPSDDIAPTTVPTSPPPLPLLVLTTPRTLCRQCDSALTIRTKPSGPFLLISPSDSPRPVLVAVHVCTKCRARHSPDHVEISHEGRKVWIWEEEARFTKVGDRVWVSKEFTRHFAALLLQQRVSPGGFASVWNDLHAKVPETKAGSDVIDGETPTEEDLDSERESADPHTFKLSPAHVWRSFVISSSVRAACKLGTPLLTIPRPSPGFLVQFANCSFFPSHDNVHVLEPHSCDVCTRDRRRNWKSGPASETEIANGVKWAGSLKPEVASGVLREDTDLCIREKARFAICDGISIGHLLCAFPSCSNAPEKSTRRHRFCESHVERHQQCGVVGCTEPVVQVPDQSTASEACSDAGHAELWRKFMARRHAVNTRGWRGRRTGYQDGITTNTASNGADDDELDTEEGKLGASIARPEKSVGNTWSLRRVAKLQLLVGSCGTPLAWTKLGDGETPHAVLRFLSLVHAQLPRSPSSFPSYIAYDRACDVLREAVLSPTPSAFQNPLETPSKRRRKSPSPLPSFLISSRLVVTGFHQQGHSCTDALCQKYCNAAPLDGSAPDLVIPFVSSSLRCSDRVFERAFNTSAAEQLNSSLRGFTHLLQGMKAENFDFLVGCILTDKKERLEGRAEV